MVKRIFKNTDGNMSIVFAVCLTMIIAGVGAAVDFSGMASQRVKYQSLADSAVLAAAASGKSKEKQLQIIANKFVKKNNFTGSKVKAKLRFVADDRIEVEVTGKYDTVLMGMFGKPDVKVAAVAQSMIGVHTYTNIALVLDVTGSMNYNARLTNMKTAASDMITLLQTHNTDKLKMSVVPFSEYVNVGMGNRNASWLEVPADWTETFPAVSSINTPVVGQENCRMETYPAVPPTGPTPPTPPSTCMDDGVSYSCGGSPGTLGTPGRPAGSHTVCDNIYGPPVETWVTPPDAQHTWKGCVGSRLAPWHENVEYAQGRKIPGIFDSDVGDVDASCPTPLREMTENLNIVKADINGLTAIGATYLPSGLMWGWRTLDDRAPLTAVGNPPAGYKERNIMVFMTDGENTISKNAERHDNSSRADADGVTKNICDKMKGTDIEVYTVTFEVIDNKAKKLVKSCATDPTYYHNATNGTQLAKAFKDIAWSIMSPRLTH